MLTLDDLFKVLKKYHRRSTDLDLVRQAFDFASKAHAGQKRLNGEDYIQHPLGAAITIAELEMDIPTVIATLLHDVAEDTSYSLVDIQKKFGEEVTNLVTGVSKLGKIKYRGIERYAENLRKMFISMARDIRVIVIKMADRLNNLKTLSIHRPDKQKRIAQEVLEIYAPIANRLGMGLMKGQLEDMAFPYAWPEEYKKFEKDILPEYAKRVKYVNKIMAEVKKEVVREKIKLLSIHGRQKHFYSLYKKLLLPQYSNDINKIYDLVAVRIIVPTVSDCYKVLGIIHRQWTPLPGRIKDYFAQPKPNNYQSLHTTIFDNDGNIVEIQVRTPEAHQQAEYGVAAHWHYKETGKHFFSRFIHLRGFHVKGYTMPKKMKWIQELARWQEEIKNTDQFLQTIKIDSFQNLIFVFTPNGDVIDLPEGATAVDFAYAIHTEIGHRCSGVKVNGHIAKLNMALKNGDVVEILTRPGRRKPNKNWLKFVKTAAARDKIRQALRRSYL